MTDVKVIIPDDFGKGIVWNDQEKKYEAISQVFFTDREATVDLQLNNMVLLFREVANSNRTMVITGIRRGGIWYGDAPDGETATNPFTGQPITAPTPIDELFLKKSDLDFQTLVFNGQNKLQAQQPPIVRTAPFDAADSSITVDTGATNVVLFMSRTATGTLRTIKGGVQGQIIYVRYVQGVAIQSTNSIRLINSTPSSTLLDSNKVSAFLCLAPGIWTELFRNFT